MRKMELNLTNANDYELLIPNPTKTPPPAGLKNLHIRALNLMLFSTKKISHLLIEVTGLNFQSKVH